MDGELYTARKQLKLVDGLELKWNQLLEEKDKIILTLEKDRDTYKARSERLQGKWDKCEGDLVDASSGPVWPYILAAVGAGLGILGAGLFIGGELSHKN